MSWRIHEPRKMTVLGLAVMKTPFIQTARGPVLKGTGRAARLNHKTTNKPVAYYIEMIPLNSSFIRAAGHDGNTLYVEFHTGETYPHPRVPYSVFEALINAGSPGTYYNQHIRGRYR